MKKAVLMALAASLVFTSVGPSLETAAASETASVQGSEMNRADADDAASNEAAAAGGDMLNGADDGTADSDTGAADTADSAAADEGVSEDVIYDYGNASDGTDSADMSQEAAKEDALGDMGVSDGSDAEYGIDQEYSVDEDVWLTSEDPMAPRANGEIDADFYGTDASEEAGLALYGLSAASITHDSKFASCTKRTGIDVSSWQGTVDWAKVKAAGVEFAFIRVAYRSYASGTLAKDTKGLKNLKEAQAAGIKVGVYIFSQAITVAEAREEADYVESIVSGYDLDLPIVMDYEYRSGTDKGRLYNANLTKAEATGIVKAFCARVQSNGHIGMLYANTNMLQEDLNASEIAESYPIWMARYATEANYAGDYTFWQYTSSGSVDGISGKVDVDVWYDDGTLLQGDYSVCDGIYTIASKLNISQVLDVADGSAANGANIQLYQSNGTNAQKFKITYLGNGLYSIANVGSGKLLDVSGGNTKNGTNVWQYTGNGTGVQKWILQATGDGYYRIVSAISGKCLDAADGRSSNGTNIQIYKSNGTDAQKFRLTLVNESRSVSDGVYTISSALSSGMVLDVNDAGTANGTNVQLYTANGTWAQKWYVKYLGDGRYTLTAMNADKALDVNNNALSDYTNVHIYSGNGTSAQKWYIKAAGDGSYYIISSSSGSYLDVSGGSAKNGTNIQIFHPNGTKAQKFTFTRTGSYQDQLAARYAGTIADGTWYIKSSISQSCVLDVCGGGKADYTNIQLYRKNNTGAQQWKVTHDAKGYVTFTNVGSGKALDVVNGVGSSGTNVWQYTVNGTNAQKWIVKPRGDGSYELIPALNTGLRLDACNGTAQNGTNVQIYTSNGTKAQGWTFQKK